jgi:hypothetical protein
MRVSVRLSSEALKMHSRWTYVATGIMAGVIGVLLTVVIGQNREPQAWAAPLMQEKSGDLQMYTGGSQTQTQDILWVVYKRNTTPPADAKGLLAKTERVTLACYQVQNGARMIKLVAVRDISFDMDIIEFGNDKPHVKDIIEDLRKNEKK